MTRLDRMLAILVLLCLALYLSVLIWYVPKPALIVICIVTVLLAAFDFAREAFGWRWRRNGRPEAGL